jgi:hypothetical protein
MQNDQILSVIKDWNKGSFLRVVYRKPLKMKKGKDQVYKVVDRLVKPGCEYDNLGVVKEGRESGELPAENAGLSGLVWAEYPYSLLNKQGEIQYRFTITGCRVYSTRYEDKDGNQVAKETAKENAYASEFPSEGTPPPVFNIRQAYIVSLANVLVTDIIAEEPETV